MLPRGLLAGSFNTDRKWFTPGRPVRPARDKDVLKRRITRGGDFGGSLGARLPKDGGTGASRFKSMSAIPLGLHVILLPTSAH